MSDERPLKHLTDEELLTLHEFYRLQYFDKGPDNLIMKGFEQIKAEQEARTKGK